MARHTKPKFDVEEVAALKAYANKVLADPNSSHFERSKLIDQMEDKIKNDPSRRGFGFILLSNLDLPIGVKPGVWCDDDGNPYPEPRCFDKTDETRRRYR